MQIYKITCYFTTPRRIKSWWTECCVWLVCGEMAGRWRGGVKNGVEGEGICGKVCKFVYDYD